MTALGHLVHGMGTAMEQPIWPAITAEEAHAVLRHFPGAGGLAKIAWHSPRPFSAACLIEAEGGEFLLKRHHIALRNPEALAEEHRFIAHLSRGGLNVPSVLRADDGSGTVTRGPSCYELHRKSAGKDIYRDDPSWTPYQSHDHAAQAGAAMARLHRAARGYAAPERRPSPLISSFTILPAQDLLAAATAYILTRPAIAAYLANKAWQEELSRLFAGFGKGLAAKLRDQPSLWTHNDWHPSNLLWSDQGQVTTIFDFGLSTRTCAVHDIATAIERCAIPWLEMDRHAPDPQAAAALLAGYNSVLPIDSETVDIIIGLLPLVHIELALSEVDYFAGLLDDPAQADIAWADFLIGHADWFASRQGKGFLVDIKSAAWERLHP